MSTLDNEAEEGSKGINLNQFDNIYDEAEMRESFCDEEAKSPVKEAQIKEYIDWNDIYIKKDAEEALLGKGSFGTVVRAVWEVKRYDGSIIDEVDVAVKVLTKSSSQAQTDAEYQEIIQRAINEVVLLKEAEKSIGSSENIVRAYGVAKGILPHDLTTLFNIIEDDEGVGIVMRYEGGGSLETLLHSRRGEQLSVRQKVYILKGIARGLAELHSIGIVHADIKPENVLLSHHSPPFIRLADFGMSVLQDRFGGSSSMGDSSLSSTTHMRGTPVYCAPEMLINPFEEFTGSVAKSSKKTDMYAFAMLAWEVLSQERPFKDLRSESALSTRVHKGVRPPIDLIPKDTPLDVIGMVELCWDKDRSQRLSSIECLAILHYQFDLHSGKKFDVFLSHSKRLCPFFSHISHALTQNGYRVWFDQQLDNCAVTRDSIADKEEIAAVSEHGIEKSSVFVLCVDQTYASSESCLNELRTARSMNPYKPVIVLTVDKDPVSWASPELSQLCGFDNQIPTLCVDISSVAGATLNSDVSQEDGPDKIVAQLIQALEPLFSFLNKNGCKQKRPSSA